MHARALPCLASDVKVSPPPSAPTPAPRIHALTAPAGLTEARRAETHRAGPRRLPQGRRLTPTAKCGYRAGAAEEGSNIAELQALRDSFTIASGLKLTSGLHVGGGRIFCWDGGLC